ncbi:MULTISPECIES: nucleoside triphosphate pyrophosphohydrolase [Bartonella]|uniref:nucleoside triphosphate pyrophosphohydrolase n=1 Tax=Bartonella TaxID=773 RepID=UPI0018DC5C69|nr:MULTISPECIES: nucleoside triphosphate pyrophosphohydrolase [Bartonella]MBH9975341.1 nucleoside triphosphate pyrophosphohydrolase [Bartonella choladocola]MBI0014948.1 nucleoside triphosphate pyrophosphohydrolase [Bartonella sp. B10834G3]
MEPSKNINRLIEIMKSLRDPETGCPWDKEQNLKTIVPYTVEEVYEVADAIDRDDKYDLCEELGDLLLQVVYYARIAEEEGSFDFGDVVYAITKKMIRRHPHVFGTAEQKERGLIKGEWERIKKEEKAERLEKRNKAGLPDDTKKGYLATVKTAQPPEKEAIALQERAAQTGFDWVRPEPVFEKIDEELSELEEALQTGEKKNIEDEFGDVYFTVLNLARTLDISPENALKKANKKFRYRFNFIENALAKQNKTLSDANLEEMEKFWNEAKLVKR